MAGWQGFGRIRVACETRPGFAEAGILADAGPTHVTLAGEEADFVRQNAIAYPTGCAV
jgi:hypothetical protein